MDKIYINDFIKNFIIRFDFSEISDDMLLEELQNILEQEHGFIINETTLINNKQVTINPETNKAKIESAGIVRQYQMLNSEMNVKVTFNNTVFLYESLKYKGFDNIKGVIESFVKVMTKGKILLFNRIGMRYINKIELPSETKEDIFAWENYISNDILNNITFIPKEKLLQTILVTDFRSFTDENILFKLQTGIPNPNKPADIVKKSFLIDIDGYTTTEEIGSAVEKLDKIHQQEKEIFEKCIKDELRKKMRGDTTNE